MLNERLCQHYGLFVEPAGLVNGKSEPASEKQPLVAGVEFKLTKLPKGSHRGGVLTQASVLTTTADGQRTSPVLRGKWVCKKILGMDLPPPPQDVPAFEVDTRGTTTIREQLAKHRADASCGSCHKVIDPPGFALENFDPFGVWREAEASCPQCCAKITDVCHRGRTTVCGQGGTGPYSGGCRVKAIRIPVARTLHRSKPDV
jgi:hypothetical protein